VEEASPWLTYLLTYLFVCLSLAVLGFEYLALARQAFYHTFPSPFFDLVVFQKGAHIFFWATSDYNPPPYDSLSYWDHRLKPPFPDYWLRRGLMNFLPWLTSIFHPSDLHLMSSWDYRCEPPYPAWQFLNMRTSHHLSILWWCEVITVSLYFLKFFISHQEHCIHLTAL
jgi:hypothetical protein